MKLGMMPNGIAISLVLDLNRVARSAASSASEYSMAASYTPGPVPSPPAHAPDEAGARGGVGGGKGKWGLSDTYSVRSRLTARAQWRVTMRSPRDDNSHAGIAVRTMQPIRMAVKLNVVSRMRFARRTSEFMTVTAGLTMVLITAMRAHARDTRCQSAVAEQREGGGQKA